MAATSSVAEAGQAAPVNDPALQIFTPREQIMIIHALLTMKEPPAVDYVKVAERMGMKNPRSVSNAWSAIRKKIAAFDKEDRKRKGLPSEDEEEDNEAGDGNDDGAKPKAKPTPKRARTAKSATPGTPTKPRGKAASAKTPGSGRGKKGKAVPASIPEDDEEEIKQVEAKFEPIVDEDGDQASEPGDV